MTRYSIFYDAGEYVIVYREDEDIWFPASEFPAFKDGSAARFTVDALTSKEGNRG